MLGGRLNCNTRALLRRLPTWIRGTALRAPLPRRERAPRGYAFAKILSLAKKTALRRGSGKRSKTAKAAPEPGASATATSLQSILILTAGFGEGHNAAARGIAKALEPLCEGRWQPDVHDLMDPSYGQTALLAKKAYAKVISHAPSVWAMTYDLIDRSDHFREWLTLREPLIKTLGQLIVAKRPPVIISVYPAYSHLLAELRKREPHVREYQVPLVTVVTDSITINRVWLSPGSAWIVSPNPETRAVLESMGTDRERILDLGFPVNAAYGLPEDRRAPLAPGEPARVLYMVNTDSQQKALKVATSLAERKDVRLIVTVGKRKKMEEAMRLELANMPNPVEVYGWTSELPRLVRGTHILIGKAGGAAVQECLAAACPMIVNEVLPGQEEGNARLIVEKGCGAVADSAKEIHEALDRALGNNAALWHRWSEAVQRASRPDAARHLAEAIVRIADGEPPLGVPSEL